MITSVERTDLRAWRERRGLTQVQLARLLGVGLRGYQRWELGERTIPPFLELALDGLIARGLASVSATVEPGESATL